MFTGHPKWSKVFDPLQPRPPYLSCLLWGLQRLLSLLSLTAKFGLRRNGVFTFRWQAFQAVVRRTCLKSKLNHFMLPQFCVIPSNVFILRKVLQECNHNANDWWPTNYFSFAPSYHIFKSCEMFWLDTYQITFQWKWTCHHAWQLTSTPSLSGNVWNE